MSIRVCLLYLPPDVSPEALAIYGFIGPDEYMELTKHYGQDDRRVTDAAVKADKRAAGLRRWEKTAANPTGYKP
jgi:hypothetical protein